jgi:hypothetical protein
MGLAALMTESTLAVGLRSDEVTTHPQEHEGWIDLLGGDLDSNWRVSNCAASTFTLVPDPADADSRMLLCTGLPTGVMRTSKMYENFLVEFEWRHMTTGWGANAGFFLWSDPLPALGVPFTRSVEVQVANFDHNSDWYTRHGDVFPIHGAVMSPDPRFGRWPRGSRSLPLEFRAKGTGQWNHYRITCIDGTVQVELNGRLVSAGYHAAPRKGYLCIESEGGEVHFRGMRLLPLPAAGRELAAAEIANSLPDSARVLPLYDGLDLSPWETDQQQAWVLKDWILAGVSPGVLTRDLPAGDLEVRLDWRFKKDAAGAIPTNLPLELGGLRVPGMMRPAGEWNRLVASHTAGSWTLLLNGTELPGPSIKERQLSLVVDSRPVDFASVLLITP